MTAFLKELTELTGSPESYYRKMKPTSILLILICESGLIEENKLMDLKAILAIKHIWQNQLTRLKAVLAD